MTQLDINAAAARTQRAKIIALLKKGMKISQLDTDGAPYYIRRLASRVSELRDLGFPIISTRITQGGVAGIVQYSLGETAADKSARREIAQRLQGGEVLTADSVELGEKRFLRLIQRLRLDGWPVLIADVDGQKVCMLVNGGGANG